MHHDMTLSAAAMPQPPSDFAPDQSALADPAIATVAIPVARFRDTRLDVFRGVALVMIYIDHIWDNIWAGYTLQNYGFSDAAEAFVLIAGISAGLAYGGFFGPGGNIAEGLRRVGRRVWLIYLVHILITMLVLAGAAALALWFNMPGLTEVNRIDVVLNDPLAFFLRMPLLTFHLDYADILPMYIVLLAVAPLALWLAWRAPWPLLAASLIVWVITGTTKINLPTLPREFGWYFDPFAWQLIFVIGLLVGVAWKVGRRLIAVKLWLLGPAIGILCFGLAVTQSETAGEWWHHQLYLAKKIGLPEVIYSTEKTYLSMQRLIHALALAYVLSAFAWVKWICASPLAAPFAVLGRHGLAVFAAGSVMAIVMQGIKTEYWRADPVLDGLMSGGGMLALLALALMLDWPRRAGLR